MQLLDFTNTPLLQFICSNIIFYSGLVFFGINLYLSIFQFISYYRNRNNITSLLFSITSFCFASYALGDFIFLNSFDNFYYAYLVNNIQFSILVFIVIFFMLFFFKFLNVDVNKIVFLIMVIIGIIIFIAIQTENLFIYSKDYFGFRYYFCFFFNFFIIYRKFKCRSFVNFTFYTDFPA